MRKIGFLCTILVLMLALVGSASAAPIISGTILNQIRDEDSAPWSLDLKTYESGNAGETDLNLDWSVSGVDTTLFTTSFDANLNIITFTPVANAHGSDVITLTLTSAVGGTPVTQDITVTLNPINDVPTAPTSITYTSPTTAYTDSTLTCVASGSIDKDGDTITYYYEFRDTDDTTVLRTWDTTNTFNCGVTGCDKLDKIYCHAKAYDEVVFSPEGAKASKIIQNSKPTVTTIPTQKWYEGTTSKPLDLSKYFSDADGDTLQYTHAFKNLLFTQITVSQSGSVFTFTPIEDDWKGETEINFTATDGVESVISAYIKLIVEPAFCDPDVLSNHLSISDIEFDDEEYHVGDKVSFEISVEATGQDVDDVQVEITLYNIDNQKEIGSLKSTKKEDIDKGDEYSFDIDFEIPNEEDIEENGKYLIYVKASGTDYDDKDQCVQDNKEIDIKREDHDVRIKKVSVLPSPASCGDAVSFVVDIENVGIKSEDDVYVKLLEGELGINEKSSYYNLEKYSKSDNDATARFTISIPENTKEKDYQIEATVYFDKGDESNTEFVTLTVADCGVVSEVGGNVYYLNFALGVNQLTQQMVKDDKAIYTLDSIPHTIQLTTISSNSVVLTISSNTQTIVVDMGETKSVDLDSNGINDLVIKLNSIQANSASLTFNKLVTAAPITTYAPVEKGLFEQNLTTTLLIIGNVVLVILLIIVLAIALRPKK